MIGETVTLTLEEAQASCRVWQERLRLSDWVIELTIRRRHEMNDDSHQGEITIYWEHKEAVIRLLDPNDFPPQCISAYDMEATLVHELLHLHLNSVGEDLSDRALEQAINCIESALIRGYRTNA